jgi:hypothetical protein
MRERERERASRKSEHENFPSTTLNIIHSLASHMCALFFPRLLIFLFLLYRVHVFDYVKKRDVEEGRHLILTSIFDLSTITALSFYHLKAKKIIMGGKVSK